MHQDYILEYILWILYLDSPVLDVLIDFDVGKLDILASLADHYLE